MQVRDLETKALGQMLGFLRVVSADPQMKVLKNYFEILVLELYALWEDDEKRDHSFPFFSLEITRTNLAKLLSSGHVTLAQLQKLADVRFSNGAEIEPDRRLESGSAKGAR